MEDPYKKRIGDRSSSETLADTLFVGELINRMRYPNTSVKNDALEEARRAIRERVFVSPVSKQMLERAISQYEK